MNNVYVLVEMSTNLSVTNPLAAITADSIEEAARILGAEIDNTISLGERIAVKFSKYKLENDNKWKSQAEDDWTIAFIRLNNGQKTSLWILFNSYGLKEQKFRYHLVKVLSLP
jgi:hypothetical protein